MPDRSVLAAPIAPLRKILQDIRASYWFIPACLSVLAVLLAWGTWVLESDEWMPEMTLGRDAARNLVTTIAAAVIGVAGVMFSLTLVAVTHAAGKYGPRLIGNFMRDRGTQWALGIMVATFVHALTTLILIDGVSAASLRLPVLCSVGLAFVSVGAMIFFIHHVPETVNVSNIAASLGQRLTRMVRAEIDEADARDADASEIPDRAPDLQPEPPGAGYIQAIGVTKLREIADEHDLIIRVEASPGSFVTPHAPLLSVWGSADWDEIRSDIDATIAIGREPTETQTLTFLADQLVEMAGIALSPGVNDPFTAITCLNWLGAALTEALEYEGGLDPKQSGRVHLPQLTFETIYDHAFHAAIPYVRDDRMASEALIAHLRALSTRCDGRARRTVLRDMRDLSSG
ncbi:DUF2254 domain-containing protein [Jannaschia aquimarina]|nr:DUF2254 domain-containing protein [Jannaschia aquimarina]